MKYLSIVAQYLYIAYQFLIMWPVFIVITIFTSVFTICTVHWRNAEFVHREQQFWSKSIFWLLGIKVTISGTEHLQAGQSYIFVANHQSMLDVWAVYGWLPVIFKWLMKKELERVPFVGRACKAAGHIFVDRTNPRAAVRSMKDIEAALTDGVCTVIFPEGTRSKNGQMGPFKRGAFMIAEHVNLPVVPISLSGCYEAWRPTRAYATRVPIHIHVGEPIELKQLDTETVSAMDYVREQVQKGIRTA